MIIQATASRWSSFADQWIALVRMWPIIETAWAATKRDRADLPQLADVQAMMCLFLPIEKALKAVCWSILFF